MKQIALSIALGAFSLPSMAQVAFYQEDEAETIVALTAIICGCALPLIIIFAVFWFKYKTKQAKYRLASQALNCGKEVPKGLFQSDDTYTENKRILSKGIKNTFLGLGLIIFLWFLTGEEGLAAIGCLISCMGIGQIVTAYVTREKNPAPNDERPDTEITIRDEE